MRIRPLACFAVPLALAACGTSRRPKAISIRSTPNSPATRPTPATRRCARRCRTRSWSTRRSPANPTPTRSARRSSPIRARSRPIGRGRQNDGTVTASGSSSSGGSKPTPAPSQDCPQCKVRNDSVTLGALASRQADRRTAGCARSSIFVPLGAAPARRSAALSRCASQRSGGGRGQRLPLRVVSFSTGAAPDGARLLLRPRHAGGLFGRASGRDGQHVLGGTRGRDGAAYVIYLQTRGDGRTEVDLVANNGN